MSVCSLRCGVAPCCCTSSDVQCRSYTKARDGSLALRVVRRALRPISPRRDPPARRTRARASSLRARRDRGRAPARRARHALAPRRRIGLRSAHRVAICAAARATFSSPRLGCARLASASLRGCIRAPRAAARWSARQPAALPRCAQGSARLRRSTCRRAPPAAPRARPHPLRRVACSGGCAAAAGERIARATDKRCALCPPPLAGLASGFQGRRRDVEVRAAACAQDALLSMRVACG